MLLESIGTFPNGEDVGLLDASCREKDMSIHSKPNRRIRRAFANDLRRDVAADHQIGRRAVRFVIQVLSEFDGAAIAESHDSHNEPPVGVPRAVTVREFSLVRRSTPPAAHPAERGVRCRMPGALSRLIWSVNDREAGRKFQFRVREWPKGHDSYRV